MSGYDALDELYERLREAEDAQDARRAGGITPETIRAARGGVADVDGREYRETGENAADGDSEPLAGDSRDSRERIEADLLALTKSWHDHDGDFMKIYSSVAYAQVKELLDRQAALTEREACAYCDYKDANRRQAHKIHEVCKCLEDSHEREKKLRAELDEYDQTHMELPVDADGVPIRVGDMVFLNGREPFEVGGVRDTRNQWHVFPYDLQRWYAPLDLHHVTKRTVESVLFEFASRVLNSGHQWGLDAPDVVAEFAAEIRELMANDKLAPESGVSGNGGRSNDGEVAL